MPRTATIVPPLDRRKIVKLYAEEIGFTEIGGQLNYCAAVVRRILVEEGVTIRGRGRPSTK